MNPTIQVSQRIEPSIPRAIIAISVIYPLYYRGWDSTLATLKHIETYRKIKPHEDIEDAYTYTYLYIYIILLPLYIRNIMVISFYPFGFPSTSPFG